jgi:ketosteroid isomerase-like protein
MTTQPSTGATTDAVVVQAVFQSFATGDVAALNDLFHADATWNHRNDDRFGGVHQGVPAILAYLGESAELTAGSLRALPQAVMGDGAGHVAVVTQVTATRPDGRSFDDLQIVLVAVEGGRVCSIDQFVGDPRAVAAFWA